jgi:hypothetical protein
MLSSNHFGRGHEPVTVQGNWMSLVTVYIKPPHGVIESATQ